MEQKPPSVVIAGRTNVGKSTLFNRLIESQKSLVSPIAGTTRDRFEADCIWRGKLIRLIDTGGIEEKNASQIEKETAKQTQTAIKDADLVLFVVDAQSGVQTEDRALAKQLLKSKTPVIVTANKADNEFIRQAMHGENWNKWPLGTPEPISAIKGTGTGDILDQVFTKLEESGTPAIDIKDFTSIRVSVIGRPNVGKSSLLNAALKEHRFIAQDKEHTTREPNDTRLTIDGQNYTLVDTAGVRKLARVNAGKSKLEQSGVERTIRAMKKSDVSLLVLDVTKKVTHQDKHLAGRIANSQSCAIIVANKWDLIPNKEPNTIDEYEDYIRYHFPMLKYAPIVFTTAVTGQRVNALFDAIDHVYQNRFRQLSSAEATRFIKQAVTKHKPTKGKGQARPNVRRFIQTHVNPPTFHIFIKQYRKEAIAESYLRYIENLLRKRFDFAGVPISIKVRTRTKKHTTIT